MKLQQPSQSLCLNLNHYPLYGIKWEIPSNSQFSSDIQDWDHELRSQDSHRTRSLLCIVPNWNGASSTSPFCFRVLVKFTPLGVLVVWLYCSVLVVILISNQSPTNIVQLSVVGDRTVWSLLKDIWGKSAQHSRQGTSLWCIAGVCHNIIRIIFEVC